MSGPTILQEAGSRPAKQLRYAPIFTNRFFTGLWTQRNPLRDPSDRYSERYFGGRPEALLDGANIELTNRLTLARRPGVSKFSTATLAEPPDYFYSFNQFLPDGTSQILLMADTASHIYHFTTSAATSIFTKSASAGQTSFQEVGSFLYFGDGVETKKWDNTTIWNWGIAAPTTQPSVTITESGSAGVSWVANTVFSTMGLMVDSNGNLWQLTSVNASGSNSTQLGKTGDGQPAWNQTLGGTTVDNTVTWTNQGTVGLWKANTTYTAGNCIYVPGVGGTPVPSISGTGAGVTFPGTTGGGIFQAYINGFASGQTAKSAGTAPQWNPTINRHTNDGQNIAGLQPIAWQYLGPAQAWQPSHTYNSWWEFWPQVICEPTLPNELMIQNGTQTVYVQSANDATTGSVNNPGTSGSGYTPPFSSVTTIGDTLSDGDLIWVYLAGASGWQPNTAYNGWSSGAATFSAIVDGNGNFQVSTTTGTSQGTTPLNGWIKSKAFALNAIIAVKSPSGSVEFKATTAGTSGSTEPVWDFTSGHTTSDGSVVWTSQGVTTAPVWGQNYGDSTTDGTTAWVNVGPSANSGWTSTTQWYLPASGFAPPSSSQPYGGANVVANSDVQYVIASGKSGASAPSWGSIGTTTTDNKATWYTLAAFSLTALVWTSGYEYAYAYKARTAGDLYSSPLGTAFGAGTGLNSPSLGTPTGSKSGGVSTASPAFVITGPNTGAVNTITGIGSTDPQVDTIEIYRTVDGGATLFFLTDIANPAPVNGQAQPWSFQDTVPDAQLNILIEAPIDDANDPPPTGLKNLTYHFGRVWGSVGGTVYSSGGPDTAPGNGAEAFPPANFFTFPSEVKRLVPTSSGLLVFTTSDIYIIAGGPATTTFFSQVFLPGYGLLSYNALDVNGGVIYFFSSANQFIALDPNAGLSEIGVAIGDQLLSFDPASAYVAFHIGGSTDTAVYLADGSTGWFRCNPNQFPDGGQVWSPKASIATGAKAVQSIVTSSGTTALLVGSPENGGAILKRDLGVWTDDGVPYPSHFTMGSIILAQPGQIAELAFQTMDFKAVGSQPTPSFLTDEISGTFTVLPSFVPDPPQLPPSQSIYANRYYYSQTKQPAWCRHMQLKIDYGSTDTVQNELLTLTVFGAHWQER